MRPCVSNDKVHSLPGALGQRCLQPVIDGGVPVVHEIDEPEERKAGPAQSRSSLCGRTTGREGSSQLFTPVIDRGVHLIDVANAVKFNSVISHIADLQRGGRRKLLLDVHVPSGDVWRAEIPVDGEDVAWTPAVIRITIQ